MSSPGLDSAGLHAEMEQLRQRNRELEQFADSIERFTYAAGHDLQEPLRAITMYSELIVKRCSEVVDEEALGYALNVMDGAARMRLLLSDLLVYAELNAADVAMDMVDLESVLETVLKTLDPLIVGSRASVTSDPLPALPGRKSDFIQLFQNLIANAVKYCRDGVGPVVHISVRHDPVHPVFAVADNGIGIEPKDHERIFEPFKRLRDKNVPGTGLGLAICNRVVKRYGGRIWVESERGQGATFIFVIPTLRKIEDRR